MKPIDVEQYTADLLDEVYPEVKIGYLTFRPSDIVKELDPVAFRCMVADEFSNLLEEQAGEINGELYYKNEVENE